MLYAIFTKLTEEPQNIQDELITTPFFLAVKEAADILKEHPKGTRGQILNELKGISMIFSLEILGALEESE